MDLVIPPLRVLPLHLISWEDMKAIDARGRLLLPCLPHSDGVFHVLPALAEETRSNIVTEPGAAHRHKTSSYEVARFR
jgi:hypothetical protein